MFSESQQKHGILSPGSDLRLSEGSAKVKQLIAMLSKMSVKSFTDLERVKKPSNVLLLATRMMCQFFSLFTNKHQGDLANIDWTQLLAFVKTVISKNLQEIIHAIKLRITSESKGTTRKPIESLARAYFGDEVEIGFRQLGVQLSGTKDIQQVVGIIHALTNHFLNTDGDSMQEQPSDKTSVCINPTSPFSIASPPTNKESMPQSARSIVTGKSTERSSKSPLNSVRS